MAGILAVVVGGILGLAALLLVWRIIRGPSVLDRIIAADALLAATLCALGAEMALNGHTHTLPVLLVLALFALVGSISVSRFISRQDKA